MKVSTVIFFVSGLVLGAAGVYFLHPRAQQPVSPGPSPQAAKKLARVSALGRIQPANGVISLGVILPDELEEVLVKEGDEVKKGKVLMKLTSQTDRQLDLDLLDRQISEAEEKLKEIDETGALQLKLDNLQLKQAEEQGPLDINVQKLKVDFLKKQTTQARDNLDKIASLTSISRQEKDQQELAALQSQSELAAADDLLQKLTLGHAMNLKLARAKLDLAKATRDRARNEVPLESLKLQRKMAAHRLEQMKVKASADGTILKILARPGELVGPTQAIVQLADLSQMAVVAEVYETDINKVDMGQSVKITSQVESVGEMTGKVVAKSRMIGKNRVYDADPLADVDRRVVEVKILLDEPAAAEKAAKLINLQVNVQFTRP
jgi:HlyD family secretion protein